MDGEEEEKRAEVIGADGRNGKPHILVQSNRQREEREARWEKDQARNLAGERDRRKRQRVSQPQQQQMHHHHHQQQQQQQQFPL